MPEIVAGPFNTALETGVRALTVLAEASPRSLDLQSLVYFDYLLVHSADAGGPDSLHPATPLRNGELLVRRSMIERGVLLLVGRGLVERFADSRGITYAASDEASPFLDCLTSPYSKSLRLRAEWAVSFLTQEIPMSYEPLNRPLRCPKCGGEGELTYLEADGHYGGASTDEEKVTDGFHISRNTGVGPTIEVSCNKCHIVVRGGLHPQLPAVSSAPAAKPSGRKVRRP